MTSALALDQLNAEQLRTLAAQLMQCVENLDQHVEKLSKQVHHFKTVNERLNHKIALFKRHRDHPSSH